MFQEFEGKGTIQKNLFCPKKVLTDLKKKTLYNIQYTANRDEYENEKPGKQRGMERLIHWKN
jgi:hypothetical protein